MREDKLQRSKRMFVRIQLLLRDSGTRFRIQRERKDGGNSYMQIMLQARRTEVPSTSNLFPLVSGTVFQCTARRPASRVTE